MGNYDTSKRARDTFNEWPNWKKEVSLTKYSRSEVSGVHASQNRCATETADKTSCSSERSAHKR